MKQAVRELSPDRKGPAIVVTVGDASAAAVEKNDRRKKKIREFERERNKDVIKSGRMFDKISEIINNFRKIHFENCVFAS